MKVFLLSISNINVSFLKEAFCCWLLIECRRRGTIEVLNPNAESGGGPFARGRVKASAMGVWRTPNEGEYANPEGLIGRRVRVYFDGDCTYFEAKVRSVNSKTQCLLLSYWSITRGVEETPSCCTKGVINRVYRMYRGAKESAGGYVVWGSRNGKELWVPTATYLTR